MTHVELLHGTAVKKSPWQHPEALCVCLCAQFVIIIMPESPYQWQWTNHINHWHWDIVGYAAQNQIAQFNSCLSRNISSITSKWCVGAGDRAQMSVPCSSSWVMSCFSERYWCYSVPLCAFSFQMTHQWLGHLWFDRRWGLLSPSDASLFVLTATVGT